MQSVMAKPVDQKIDTIKLTHKKDRKKKEENYATHETLYLNI